MKQSIHTFEISRRNYFLTISIIKLLITLSLLSILLFSCSSNNDNPSTNSLVSISLSSPASEIELGIDNNIIKYIATGTFNNDEQEVLSDILWNSSDQTVASINSEGFVTALTEGETMITAKTNGVVGEAILTVSRFNVENKSVFKNVSILTMESEVLLENQTVLIENGFISKLGPEGSFEIPNGVLEIDGNGKVLMPGLSDMHVHPFFETDYILYLANGVTSVLDMGNSRNFTNAKGWKNDVIRGELAGPNIYVAAMVRGENDGGNVATIARTPEEGRSFVNAHYDYDFIKVYNFVESSTFDAIVDEASLYGISVIGHGVRSKGMNGILEGGQKMIAHAEEYLYSHFNGTNTQEKINEAINMTSEAGAYVTGTLSTFEAVTLVWNNNIAGYQELKSRPGYQYTNPLDKPDWDYQFNVVYNKPGTQVPNFEFQKTFMTDFYEAGIPILLGTDSPIIIGMAAGFSIHDDIRIYSEMGINSFDILKMGTVNAASFMDNFCRTEEQFGKVKEGYRADLVLLNANPLLNLEELRQPHGVMVRGRWYTKEFLDEQLEILRN